MEIQLFILKLELRIMERHSVLYSYLRRNKIRTLDESQFTQTESSGWSNEESEDEDLKSWEVDKLEVKAFLSKNNRDSTDIKYFIEEWIICADYSSRLFIIFNRIN